MDINTMFMSLFLAGLAYVGFRYFSIPKTVNKFGMKPLWGEQVGKTKQIQSMTGDASMATELKRRRAIQSVGRWDYSKLKETQTQKGSATGAVETFMLSSICPLIPRIPDTIYDGGNDVSEYCPYDGTGTHPLDAGNENTKVCGL